MKHTTPLWLILLAAACATGQAGEPENPSAVTVSASRSLEVGTVAPQWDLRQAKFVPAISYSGYREGQSPDTGVYPSKAEIQEDLRIVARQWKLIRLYGSDAYAEAVLEIIRKDNIDLKVMLGAWLAKEPGNEHNNARQIDNAIRLANAYTDIVVAVNVGNEILVSWTAHPVPVDRVIAYVKRVKHSVTVPVTVADNYAWWRDHGTALANEVDFLTIHTYPVWERKGIDQGLSYTIENYDAVKRALPGKNIVIGEAGWPSYSVGNQHVPRAGTEEKQKRYVEELTAWAKANKVTVFFFEAFDEPWKGTGTTEGHWGLFSVDRKAKLCMQGLYPDLMPDGPTSPDYAGQPEQWGPSGAIAFRDSLAPKLGNCSVNPHGPGIRQGSVVADTRAVEGKASLRFAHNGSDWGGLYLLFDPIDGRSHSKIVMRLHAPAGLASLEFKVEGPPTKASAVNLMRYRTATAAEGWTTFAVPLADLNNVDLSQITIVGLWNPKSSSGAFLPCEISVDDIHFE